MFGRGDDDIASRYSAAWTQLNKGADKILDLLKIDVMRIHLYIPEGSIHGHAISE